ncbi:sperm acrosome-associated protein 5 [Microcaecilia unicolor]|uniref:Sperm acrosome-associated protein 5-like n=1 Tax=Microcaecilia unicolor TaxID=1415580 RepID=A0A6P7XUT5_9AMPH|nr:sperm acrosome-associated protein 5-like [Microcaecilia unicolor]
MGGLDGCKGYYAEDYACLAYYKTFYDTSYQHSTEYGITEYGIFGIRNCWCNEYEGDNNPCGIPCSDLTDENIFDDMDCVKTIIFQNGMDEWYSWSENCEGKDLSYFSCDYPY